MTKRIRCGSDFKTADLPALLFSEVMNRYDGVLIDRFRAGHSGFAGEHPERFAEEETAAWKKSLARDAASGAYDHKLQHCILPVETDA